MTKYRKIGDTGLYSECKECGVWIQKGKMMEHRKTDCDGEEGKKERREMSLKVLGDLNKIGRKLGLL